MKGQPPVVVQTPEVALTDLAEHAPEGPSAGVMPSRALDDTPSYPWGTQVDLNPETVSKMNLPAVPQAGHRVRVVADAHIKSVRAEVHPTTGEKKHHITLQLTHLGMAEAKGPPPKASRVRRAPKEGTAAEERAESPAKERAEKASGKGDAPIVAVAAHMRKMPAFLKRKK